MSVAFPHPDLAAIGLFVETMFRYAEPGGHVSLRCFRDDIDGSWNPAAWSAPRIEKTGLAGIIAAAGKLAAAAAAAAEKVVFAPPVATFKTPDSAAEKDIYNGVELIVECDATPEAARERLENLLGPATIAVASGGVWVDPESGIAQDKLHLHWRLDRPTRAFPDHVKLKEARRLAMVYAGADATAVPLVHPLRWPGSWHRKAEPRLARIVSLRAEVEIILDEALRRLQEAVAAKPKATPPGGSQHHHGGSASPADILDIVSALSVIPNDDLDWKAWNDIAMATWTASSGSPAGLAAFIAWSSKSRKFDETATRARWDHIAQYPPDRIGAGTLFFMAQQAWPGWKRPSEQARTPPVAWPPLKKIEDDETEPPPGAPPQARLDAMIDEMNQRFAVVNEAGRAMIYQPSFDWALRRQVRLRLRPADLKTMFANRKLSVPVAAGGTTTKTWADWWLSHPRRRQYLGGVVCDPTRRVPATCWNLYTGLAVTPEPGDWSRMRLHIEGVICSNVPEWNGYLLDTVARMLQHPEKRGEVAVVLRGKKGSGKGILLNYLKYAWGQHGMHIANAQHLTGNFNAHLRDCIFLFADEAFFANDRRHESVLKALITEPTLPIEGKGIDVVEAVNLLHVFLASNADWVVPASIQERRFFVLDVLDTMLGQIGYFRDLAEEMDNGGLAGMLWDLLRRDIGGFDPRAVPETTALREQKLHSLDSLHRWWLAVLGRGFVWKSRHGADTFREWHDFYTTELLWRSYLQWCGETRPFDRRSRVQLGKFMTGIYYATRPSAEHAVYELDSIDRSPVAVTDPATGSVTMVRPELDEITIVRKPNCPGYQVNAIEEARVRFTDVVNVETEWGLSP